MSLRLPPAMPGPDGINPKIYEYLLETNLFLNDVYQTIRNMGFKDMAITTDSGVPTGGQDGDLYIRKAGASTALYININGSWSAYTNP